MTTTIQEYVTERGIKTLWHFTKLDSLDSILKRGLVTRNVLVGEGNTAVCNDQHRLDGTNAICLSIGFPNYKMFWSLRQTNPGVDWIVLGINPNALWQLRCVFCAANAASNGVTSIPLQKRMTIDAFKKMFGDFGEKQRATLGLGDHLPTNPQAEVLMLDGVPIRYVLGAFVLNIATQQKVQAMHPGFDVRIHAGYFRGRSDYTHWK